jgi:phage terminase large subunit GpA-like protein
MLDNTSQNSQNNPLNFDDGAFLQALREGLRPDVHLSVSAWADKHRVLDTRSSAEAGQWRTSRTPYLKEPMDCLSVDSPVQRVVMMTGAQIGKTETGNNWIGYIIDHAPGPIMAVQPTLAMAQRFSKQRLDPLIAASDRLSIKIPAARSRDSGNTTYSKEFPGGILILTGANSATGLRSMPARYLFLDEVDAYPGDLEGEGDPVSLAEARTRTFGRRRKILMTSTPTIRGLSRVEREFDMTDQRRYHVPCPHCGTLQWLKFERLKWEWGQSDKAAYICEGCDEPIREHHKTWMMDPENGAAWMPTAEPQIPHARGYHISSLYSPLGWMSWAQIAQDWETAQGNDDAIKAFKNGILGETWTETGDAPDWKRLYERREEYKRQTVPNEVIFLTAGVDVQKNRLEISVYGWGRGLESWLVDHEIIDGGAQDPLAWAELEAIIDKGYPCEDGRIMPIRRAAIDTGYETQVVYSWARRMASPVIMPIKGEEKFDKSQPVAGPTIVDILENGRRIRRGARLWKVAVATFKSETYRWLRLEKPTDEELADGGAFPSGYIHTPMGIDGEWFKQLTAEQLMARKDRRGFTRYEWQKIRERNEALDCRVYARAAAYSLGADFWPAHRWDRAQQAADNLEVHEPPAHTQGETKTVAPRPVRPAPPAPPASRSKRKKGPVRPNW